MAAILLPQSPLPAMQNDEYPEDEMDSIQSSQSNLTSLTTNMQNDTTPSAATTSGNAPTPQPSDEEEGFDSEDRVPELEETGSSCSSSEEEDAVPEIADEDDNDDNDNDAAMDAALDEAMSEEDDQVDEDEEEEEEELPVETTKYGGLVNLGNTCYMASALQMLASLDGFVERLEVTELNSAADGTVRRELIELVQRLSVGEHVSPDDFKDALDERCSLFVGYEQQDAHEFVTTLLDMIDEDYKKKETLQEERDQSETNEMAESETDDVVDNVVNDDDKTTKEDDELNENDASSESVCKKPRTCGPSVDDQCSVLDSPSGCIQRSFSKLGVDEIGHLLHANETQRRRRTLSECSQDTGPKCKLIGGCMRTDDVKLTPYTLVTSENTNNTSHRESDETGDSQSQSMETSDENAAEGSTTAEDSEPSQQTPVDSYLATTVRVRLTCDSCKYTRTHKERYLHMSLEIGQDCGSVEDGMRRFFAPEKRELKCEKCFSESATQSMEIIQLPRALLLHFKRFIVDVSPDYSSISYRKNRSVVEFDDTLKFDEDAGGFLNDFLASDCLPPRQTTWSASSEYSLRSVVKHMGSSANCGHYTADAKRFDEEGERQWFRFNDDFVTRISKVDATEHSQETAYMVLYELEC